MANEPTHPSGVFWNKVTNRAEVGIPGLLSLADLATPAGNDTSSIPTVIKPAARVPSPPRLPDRATNPHESITHPVRSHGAFVGSVTGSLTSHKGTNDTRLATAPDRPTLRVSQFPEASRTTEALSRAQDLRR